MSDESVSRSEVQDESSRVREGWCVQWYRHVLSAWDKSDQSDNLLVCFGAPAIA